MKKLLLTVWITGTSILAYSQFVPGNLVVVQASNAAADPQPTVVPFPAPSVSLVEFAKTGGSPVSAFALPATGAGRVVLANGSGLSTFEGFLKLSVDKNHITFAGFDADTNTIGLNLTDTIAVKRLLVSVDKNKAVSTTRVNEAYKTYLRYVVAIDKDHVYTGSDGQDIRYLDLTNLPANKQGVKIAKPANGSVSANIFYGKLWYANTRNAGEISVFPGLPTALSSPSTKIKRAAGLFLGNITDFILFDTDGDNEPDLGYIGTDGSITGSTTEDILYKVALEDVGGTPTWVGKGSFNGPAAPNAQIGNARKVQGLTGYKNADGKYELFYSTFTSIVTFVDGALPSAAMVATPTIIASAPANSIFRGLSFTPGTTETVLPIELKSFNGKTEGESIRLDWSTGSEKNNARFEVLRSASSTPSEMIGTVVGNGNSVVANNYTFVDANPIAGTNYYQLNQVDFNGKSQKSKVIAVKSGLKKTTLTVRQGQGDQISANVYAEKTGSGRISVSNIAGSKVAEIKVTLQKGYNNVPLNGLGIKSGVYLVTLNTAGKNLTVKLVK